MILLTGATGILGRVIALYLLKKGKQVLAVKRPASNLSEVKDSFKYYTDNHEEWFDKINWVDVDFDDIEDLQRVLKGVDEVYHCAANVSFYEKDKKELFNTNSIGTQNWLYACQHSSVKKFCFVSSIAVLDGVNENGILDETSDYNPKINHSSYAVSKHFAEMEVWRASSEGLNTVIINPGVIIGSGNWNKSSGMLLQSFEKSKYSTSGTSAYIDVRDVANLAITLMEKNAFGERFILISENKSFAEIGNIIREKLQLSRTKLISDRTLKLFKFLSIFKFIFPKLEILSTSGIEMLTSKTFISNHKIKTLLKTDFIPVKASLKFHLDNYTTSKNK